MFSPIANRLLIGFANITLQRATLRCSAFCAFLAMATLASVRKLRACDCRRANRALRSPSMRPKASKVRFVGAKCENELARLTASALLSGARGLDMVASGRANRCAAAGRVHEQRDRLQSKRPQTRAVARCGRVRQACLEHAILSLCHRL